MCKECPMYTKTKNIRAERQARAKEVAKKSWWAPVKNGTPAQKIRALDEKFGEGKGASTQRAKLAKALLKYKEDQKQLTKKKAVA
jgi:hypothetical protein